MRGGVNWRGPRQFANSSICQPRIHEMEWRNRALSVFSSSSGVKADIAGGPRGAATQPAQILCRHCLLRRSTDAGTSTSDVTAATSCSWLKGLESMAVLAKAFGRLPGP